MIIKPLNVNKCDFSFLMLSVQIGLPFIQSSSLSPR